jgi:hypothetical protein
MRFEPRPRTYAVASRIVACIDQINGSSDGGAIVLKAADCRYGLIQAPAGCLRDKR